ncbi:MAG: butyrate kinase [Planctomycetales bacterium]|nr:butyrate kinase [bacterium]UNM08462.1 MAG: butyrate kinase [Planctomycetales bacterium]
MEAPLLLVVNLGASSSKLALFDGAELRQEANLPLDDDQAWLPLLDQLPLRREHLRRFLAEHGVEPGSLSAVAARGGMMKPLSRRGVIRVDEAMLDDLRSCRFGEHPSSLSALCAVEMLQEDGLETPVYVVDPVSVDTLCDEARLSGVPGITRRGRHHALNVHYVAVQVAERLKRPLHQLQLVVAHFGSGVSICSVRRGRVIDVNDAQLGEGPFSVSRAGSLPIEGLLQLAEQQTDHSALRRTLSRYSGMAGYTGTGDFRAIERRLEDGDNAALRSYDAMLFQSAKYVAAYAGSLGQRPDAVVITGAMLHSTRFLNDLRERISWIAPVYSYPGEAELQALADGVAGVIEGSETAFAYSEIPTPEEAPPHGFDELIRRAADCPPLGFVVAGAASHEVAETVSISHSQGFTGFVLVGVRADIEEHLAEAGVPINEVEIIDSTDIVADSIAEVQRRPGSVLVKGKCDTAALLRGVLGTLPHEEKPFLSHCAVFEDEISGRLIGLTDGGLNVAPDIHGKMGMLKNALAMFHALGHRRPHVMLAAGMEDKGQNIPAIRDGAEIVRLHREEGLWPDAVVDGPFGMDVALSAPAAMRKGIHSPVAGRADIIVTPNLEACNISVKLAVIYTGKPWGGLVMGGPFPVIVGSRADEVSNRVCSIALARLVAAGLQRREG